MDLIRICKARLQSVSPYSSSRMFIATKLHENETPGEVDQRLWREKCTVNSDGIVCIAGMALKQALDNAATRMALKIPGKGSSRYAKHFHGGILVDDLVPLGVHKDAVGSVTINAHSTGKRTDGTRVPRIFPVVQSWTATATFFVIDSVITPDVFERTLAHAGFFVGVGRFRPENKGTNGRFKVVSTEWSEQTVEQVMAA